MIDEDHDGWMELDGTPAVGRRPPVTIVYAPPGVVLTDEQSSAVSHEFTIFRRWVKTSSIPDGFHTHHVEFADGSRADFRAMQGEFTTEVWITGGSTALLFRGFVIKPRFEDGEVSTWTRGTALLRHASSGTWNVWVSPYEPGKAAPPSYFVDEVRSAPQAGMQEEAKWFDVYLWAETALYLNGARSGQLPSNNGGLFTLLKQTDPEATPARVFFTANSTELYRASSTLDLLHEFSHGFPGSSLVYDCAPRVAPPETLRLSAMAVTSAGAFQVKHDLAALLREPPWATITAGALQQINVPSPFIATGGYDSVSTFTPDAPLYGPTGSEATVCGWIYPAVGPPEVTSSFGYKLYGNGLGTNQTMERLIYDKTIPPPDNGSIQVADGITATYSRSVTVNSVAESGSVNWSNKWPGPRCWTAVSMPGSPSEAGLYGMALAPPSGTDSPSIQAGDLIQVAVQEIGGTLDQSDTGTCQVALSIGGVIFQSSTTHSTEHIEADIYENSCTTPYATRDVGNRSYFYDTNGDGFLENILTNWPHFVYPVQFPLPGVYRGSRVETLDVSASSKDYIYFDSINSVYVWLDSSLSGSRVETKIDNNTPTVSGSFTLTCRLMLSSPAGVVQGPPRVFTHSDITTNLRSPDDIVFGTTNRVWQHASPRLAFPIFVPKWFDQSNCPHMAYTTAAEEAAGVTPTLLASWCVQVLLQARPALADVPVIAGAMQTTMPMMEQLLSHHFPGIYYGVMSSIEAEPFTLNASYPGSDVHGDIGIEGANPKSEFYRS